MANQCSPRATDRTAREAIFAVASAKQIQAESRIRVLQNLAH